MTNLNECNQDMHREIDIHETANYCYNCGTCVSGCPASNAALPLLIRNLVRMSLLGLEDDLLDDDTPWTCVTCSRCEEMCPMDVHPFELCLNIRKWQCRNDETRIPPGIVEIYHRGYTQPVEKSASLRASVGITEPLPTLTACPDLLKDFQTMLMEIKIIKDNKFMFGG